MLNYLVKKLLDMEEKNIVNEELFLEAGMYPENWDMELFKKLPTFSKRVRYAQERLGKIGSGSARVVFSVDGDTVIKIAKNVKGIDQNRVEADIGTKDWHPCSVRVVDYDEDDYLWIEAEKARKVKKSEFKKLLGYDFDLWTSVLYFKIKQVKNGVKYDLLNREQVKPILEDEFFNDIVEMSVNFDIEPGDFRRINSWGIVRREGAEMLVLIDIGLSNQVYQDYYYSGPRF